MLKFLIADDEQLECLTLQQTLQNYYKEGCKITLASNGQDAVKRARENGADIAVLDIEMPGISGLEAARRIRQFCPACKIVFLTAYSEFRYACEAVKLGAVNYLLKPCSDEELLGVMRKVVCCIEEERKNEENRETAACRIQTLTEQAEEQMVLSVMGGYLRPEHEQVHLERLGIKFAGGVFVILKSPSGLSAQQIHKMVQGKDWEERFRLFAYEYDDKLYMLVFSSQKDAASALKEKLRVLSEHVFQEKGMLLYASLGTIFQKIEDAQNSFGQAYACLKHCTSQSCVVQEQEAKSAPCGVKSGCEPMGARSAQAMQEITRYIAQNYSREIFLQQVACEMNYSEAYFSKLFKQCFHKNFITYLTEVRVEAAKKLLSNPAVNIKEVGRKVGYQDPNYFTKVFRRATAETPSEYRERMCTAS